ncbi:MAG: hypothetical protein H7Y11_09325, partial [Armatimonadetes bacterium]|nr:hypothetical protein [Anaerolineae bacterium]
MIVSVTANTTLDLTLFVPDFDWGRTIRASDYIYSMGGKPTDASYILGTLGTPSLALGFAAGATGSKVEAMLRGRGVNTDFVQVDGETRICINLVVTDGRGQTTVTTNMMQVTPAHLDQLRARYNEALATATVVVLGGTLPHGIAPDFYPEL